VAAADCTLHPYSRQPPPELGSIRLPPQCGENLGDAPGKLFFSAVECGSSWNYWTRRF